MQCANTTKVMPSKGDSKFSPLSRVFVSSSGCVSGPQTADFALLPPVVISQVYTAGGESGATYRNDFVELFNRGDVTIDLTGWSIQYASDTGTTWQRTNLNSATLLPGQHYLVQESAGGTNGSGLPAADALGGVA